MPVALITGASRGLGRATACTLAERGWSLVTDARRPEDLTAAMRGLADVVVIPGDVTDPGHRADLAAAVGRLGRLDVLVTTPAGSAQARYRGCGAHRSATPDRES